MHTLGFEAVKTTLPLHFRGLRVFNSSWSDDITAFYHVPSALRRLPYTLEV